MKLFYLGMKPIIVGLFPVLLSALVSALVSVAILVSVGASRPSPCTHFCSLHPLHSSLCRSIGSLGKDGELVCISNIDVSNCVLRSLQNGLRIKTYQGGQGTVANVRFSNVTITNVANPIYINQAS